MTIIDALDECTLQNQEVLLSALDEIQEKSRDLVKLFVTSQHVQIVAAHLKQSKNIEMTEEMNQEDLKRFVKNGVDHLSTNDFQITWIQKTH